MKDKIFKALWWRYAVKKFKGGDKLPRDLVEAIIESGRLAPSSYGIESWHLYHVTDQSVRNQLLDVSYGQEKVANSSDLFVITAVTDGMKLADKLGDNILANQEIDPEKVTDHIGSIKDSVKSKREQGTEFEWLKSQTYIMLGFMLYTAAMLGVDACPMEGFQADKVGKILNLPDDQVATTMLAIGYRSSNDEWANKTKVRQSLDDFVTTI